MTPGGLGRASLLLAATAWVGLVGLISLGTARGPALVRKAGLTQELAADDVACVAEETRCEGIAPAGPPEERAVPGASGAARPMAFALARQELEDRELGCTIRLPSSPTGAAGSESAARVGATAEGVLILYEERERTEGRGRRAHTVRRWVSVKERRDERLAFVLDAARARHPAGVCAVAVDRRSGQRVGMTVVGADLAFVGSLRDHAWLYEVLALVGAFALWLGVVVVWLQLRRHLRGPAGEAQPGA